MHAAINTAIQKGHFEKQINSALDLKIYARVLALRLGKYIWKLVHSDKSGFIPHHSLL